MDLWATKDHYENETDEAERLVRPAPKVKPPRDDKKREDVHERDPDTDGDPDLKGDPDMSVNYKNVGGSMVDRVAGRFIEAKKVQLKAKPKKPAAPAKDVSVYDTKQKKVVSIPETRVKNDPGRYKPVKPGDKAKDEPTAPKDAPKTEPESKGAPKAPAEAEKPKSEAPAEKPKSEEGEKPKASPIDPATAKKFFEDNPKLLGMAKELGNPKSRDYATLQAIKDHPLKNLRDYKNVELPEGVKTLADLAVAHAALSAPSEAEKPKGEKPNGEKPNGEGENPKGEPKAVDPNEAWEATQALVKKNPALSSVVDLADPENPRHGHYQSIKDKPLKSFGELAKLKFPAGIDTVEDLVKAAQAPKPKSELLPEDAEPGDSAESVVKRFLSEKKQETPEFDAFVKSLPSVDEDKDGKPLFPDSGARGKGPKKFLPFDKLSPETKQALVEQFETRQVQKATKHALTKMRQDPQVKEVLQGLADPDSKLNKQINDLVKSGTPLDELLIKKTLPGLKGVELPEGVRTVHDLQQALKTFPVDVPIVAPQPPRKDLSPEETDEIWHAVARSFPPDQAVHILGLHPADQKAVLSAFNEVRRAKMDDPDGFVQSVRDTYQTDPEKIGPPKTVMVGGHETKFEDLSKEEQHEAWQKHRNHVLAVSLAAPAIVAAAHEKRGVPKALAQSLAEGALSGGASPKRLYEEGLSSPMPVKQNPKTGELEEQWVKPATPKEIKKTLDALTDEGDRRAAVAYYKARDYQVLRDKFLDAESPDSFNEFHSPHQILNGLKRAVAEAEKMAKSYPSDIDDGINVAADFRRRVLHRLNTLSPEKMGPAREWSAELNAKEYEAAQEKREAQMKEIAKKNRAAEKADPYRAVIIPEPPEIPMPPDYYDVRKNPSGRSSTKSLDSYMGPVKLAHRVASRFAFSTCTGSRAMSTTPLTRQAVYWGVEPYKETAAYPGWQQAQARDLGDADHALLLREAWEWLKNPILSSAVEGIVPDTQYRAALEASVARARRLRLRQAAERALPPSGSLVFRR